MKLCQSVTNRQSNFLRHNLSYCSTALYLPKNLSLSGPDRLLRRSIFLLFKHCSTWQSVIFNHLTGLLYEPVHMWGSNNLAAFSSVGDSCCSGILRASGRFFYRYIWYKYIFYYFSNYINIPVTFHDFVFQTPWAHFLSHSAVLPFLLTFIRELSTITRIQKLFITCTKFKAQRKYG